MDDSESLGGAWAGLGGRVGMGWGGRESAVSGLGSWGLMGAFSEVGERQMEAAS